MWFALRLAGARRAVGLGLSSAAVLVGIAMVRIGKMRFAASYGDDALAGRAWFLGWIILMAAVFLLLATLMQGWRRAAR